MNKLDFVKTVTNFSKLERELKAEPQAGTIYAYCLVKGEELSIYYKQNLNQAQVDAVSILVNNFSNISVIDQMEQYLAGTIDPFGAALMKTIRAENITMGITQSGKTGDVLGFFSKHYLLPGKTFAFSLQDTFNSSSFYETLALMTYLQSPEMQSEYSSLSPFITVERLEKWKQEIIEALNGG